MTLADNILIAIKTNNPNPVQADLAQIMDSVYGRAQPSCWTLWYYVNDEKKALASVDCKGRKSVIFDEETLLPAAASEAPIKIRLTVTGYTQ
jgi:hypothetical protein